MSVHEHRTGLEHETGFGLGELDYYCWDCFKWVRSVPLANMNEQERAHVGRLGIMAIELTDKAEKQL